MELNIRTAVRDDLPALSDLYAAARRFMVAHGNPDQWGSTHPPMELIASNIEAGSLRVCCRQGGSIAGAFSLFEHEDTYDVMQEGHWLNDEPYLVMHSVAAYPGCGAGSFMIRWVQGRTRNIRIDTKKENLLMRSLLQRLGFVYCGVIALKAGRGERLAYQWTARGA